MPMKEHKSDPVMLLEYFINQLANYIVEETEIVCSVCSRDSCSLQPTNCLSCRDGVKAWLMERRHEFEESLPGEIDREFSFLDNLRASGAVNMYGAVPYLQEAFPQWSQDWHKWILRTWMETCKERTAES